MELHRIQNRLLIFDTPEEVARAAAERFVKYANEAIAERGVFSVALAGGNTPRRVYELLASDPFKSLINWSSVHLFFGDERFVPPDHPDSNYRMVYKTLISAIDIPAQNVHRMLGEGNAEESAAAYEQELRCFFGEDSWPRFDLVLLGMGEDGHTASLFPGSNALKEEAKWVVATRMENPLENQSQGRITLTVPVFNHAARVLFLVTGKGKAERLAEVLHPPRGARPDNAAPLPAQLIQPLNGSLDWLIDKAAASTP
jgi:6-phosphogluconolactonase